MEGTLVALNTGKAGTIEWQGKGVSSAINKEKVQGPLYLSRLNFDGDEQADTIHHGGPEKAVCVYSYDHYPYWEKGLGITLQVPTFGENLTVNGLTEDQVFIGDIFKLGEAVVQVCQPRQPCFKVAAKLNQPFMVKWIQDTGYSGYYMRVLEEGRVDPQDKLVLQERNTRGISVEFVNSILYRDKENKEGVMLLAELDELAEGVKTSMQKRLQSFPG